MNGIVARMDDWGRPAWIAAMIAAFVLFWPLGLAILGYMIWSGRMGCSNYAGTGWQDARRARWERKMDQLQQKMARWGGGPAGPGFRSTGNRAFDEYREETLKRLEDEAAGFHDFLDRLRMARDKAEFDQFMAERRNRGTDEPGAANPVT